MKSVAGRYSTLQQQVQPLLSARSPGAARRSTIRMLGTVRKESVSAVVSLAVHNLKRSKKWELMPAMLGAVVDNTRIRVKPEWFGDCLLACSTPLERQAVVAQLREYGVFREIPAMYRKLSLLQPPVPPTMLGNNQENAITLTAANMEIKQLQPVDREAQRREQLRLFGPVPATAPATASGSGSDITSCPQTNSTPAAHRAATREILRINTQARNVQPSRRFLNFLLRQGIVSSPRELQAYVQELRKDPPLVFRLDVSCGLSSVVYRTIRKKYSSIVKPVRWYNDALRRVCWSESAKDEELPCTFALTPLPVLQRRQGSSAVSPLTTLYEQARSFLHRCQAQRLIQVQSLSSMVPPIALNPTPDGVVLDMCAAPGSKTTQLADVMLVKSIASYNQQCRQLPDGTAPSTLQRAPPSGTVIANEFDKQRYGGLVSRVTSATQLLAVNCDARDLRSDLQRKAHLSPLITDGGKFSHILVDVECSGDGLMAKKDDIWRTWAPGLGNKLHDKQIGILMEGLAMLSTRGGRLVYSTCTTNPVEDEAVVSAALRACGGAVRLVPVDGIGLAMGEGLTKWAVPGDMDGRVWHESMSEVEGGIVDVDVSRTVPLSESMFPPSQESDDIVIYEQLKLCRRIYPHINKGMEPFFIAVFEKTGTMPLADKPISLPSQPTLGMLGAVTLDVDLSSESVPSAEKLRSWGLGTTDMPSRSCNVPLAQLDIFPEMQRIFKHFGVTQPPANTRFIPMKIHEDTTFRRAGDKGDRQPQTWREVRAVSETAASLFSRVGERFRAAYGTVVGRDVSAYEPQRMIAASDPSKQVFFRLTTAGANLLGPYASRHVVDLPLRLAVLLMQTGHLNGADFADQRVQYAAAHNRRSAVVGQQQHSMDSDGTAEVSEKLPLTPESSRLEAAADAESSELGEARHSFERLLFRKDATGASTPSGSLRVPVLCRIDVGEALGSKQQLHMGGNCFFLPVTVSNDAESDAAAKAGNKFLASKEWQARQMERVADLERGRGKAGGVAALAIHLDDLPSRGPPTATSGLLRRHRALCGIAVELLRDADEDASKALVTGGSDSEHRSSAMLT